MVTDLFERHPVKRSVPSASPEPAAKSIESCDAFGWLANDRDRALMLEIRHANGDITALAYTPLESARFNPSTGITLSFSRTTVKLVGRNLNGGGRKTVRLFEGIIRHQVVWVVEADETTLAELLETDVVIDEIIVDWVNSEGTYETA